MADEFIKHPNDKLDYPMDWVDWLNGDTVGSSLWTVSPAGLTISSSPAPSTFPSYTVVWLEGGTNGQTYIVSNKITTTAGRVKTRSVIVHVRTNYNNQ